jgi:primosomal protein N' (replication factor Y) (superfamily II helicase)
MIAQGLDFPRVTLVGVLDADRGLRFPDFRAGERTFQLLTQVSGRAGRADKPGEVFLQTRNPEHYAIRAATKLDYKAFAEEELKFRREMGYPPYARLAQALLRGKDAGRVEKAADGLVRWLLTLDLPPEVQVLGPAPSFHALKAGHVQWQALIKAPESLIGLACRPLREYKPPKGVSVTVDVDPEELP